VQQAWGELAAAEDVKKRAADLVRRVEAAHAIRRPG